MDKIETKMTPFRCPVQLLDRVRLALDARADRLNIKRNTMTDTLIVALTEWCDRQDEIALAALNINAQTYPSKPKSKKLSKKKGA
jgi:hypothetical protein